MSHGACDDCGNAENECECITVERGGVEYKCAPVRTGHGPTHRWQSSAPDVQSVPRGELQTSRVRGERAPVQWTKSPPLKAITVSPDETLHVCVGPYDARGRCRSCP